jgi:membrane-associated phospholipid phosphatase
MARLIDPPAVPACARPWAAELARRVRSHTALKILGIGAFMWVFFLGYFHLLRHPAHAVTIMPLTAIDRIIPFQPQTLAIYLSLWLYIGVAPGLLLTLRELGIYALWLAALCLTGLACFYFCPTTLPALAMDFSGHPGFAMLKAVDAAGNACPSLHVATAMFTAIWVDSLLRRLRMPTLLRVINGGWFAAIAYSTLATKQHVALDVLAGALLGIAFALPALRWQFHAGESR